MSLERYYKRSYTLKIIDYNKKEEYVFHDLDIKFRCKRQCSVVVGELQLEVFGLRSELINDMCSTSISSYSDAVNIVQKRIILTAGYTDHEVNIFDGYIINASISRPPELSTSITAWSYLKNSNEIYRISCNSGMSLYDVFNYCAQKMNVSFYAHNKGKLETTKTSVPFVANGDRKVVLDNLQSIRDDMVVFLDNSTLFVYNKFSKVGDDVYHINRMSGLIEVSGVDLLNGTFKTFLSNDVPLCNYIEVSSDLFSKANGKYRIMAKEYVGHFRGKEWYTIYHNALRMRE